MAGAAECGKKLEQPQKTTMDTINKMHLTYKQLSFNTAVGQEQYRCNHVNDKNCFPLWWCLSLYAYHLQWADMKIQIGFPLG
jgi:hypothetical protein